MVENTRLKELSDTQARHTEDINTISQRLAETARVLSELKVSVGSLNQKHDSLAPLVSQLVKGKEVESAEGSNRSWPEPYVVPPLREPYNQQTSNNNLTAATQVSRLEFPEFDGSYPRLWLRKANRYFQYTPMDTYAKVSYAAYHLVGKADLWYFEYMDGQPDNTWERFMERVLERFLQTGHEDVVIEFNRLSQIDDVTQYVSQFEELKSLVRAKHPELTEEYLISCFMKGLKEEIRVPIQLFRATNLTELINHAKMLERTLEVWGKKSPRPFKPNISSPKVSPNIQSQTQNQRVPAKSPPILKTKWLSDEEYNKRKARGLCFHCDEKYTYGHQCNPKLFNIMLCAESELEALTGEDIGAGDTQEEQGEEEMEGELSLQALNGNKTNNSMKLIGYVNKHKLSILVDTGATHSFINLSTAITLRCEVEETQPWVVKLATGTIFVCREKCRAFFWVMQGYKFESDLRVIPLGGGDIILGADWLWRLDPVTFHFRENFLVVRKDGKKVKLKGAEDKFDTKEFTGKGLKHLLQKASIGFMAQLYSVEAGPLVHPQELEPLLTEFADIFQEPTGLPPMRNIEHHITLQDGSKPVHQKAVQLIRETLITAQNRMKQFADRNRSERSFKVGDWVFLKIQPFKGTWSELRNHTKLGVKFFGPFEVLDKVGEVAYRLNLPTGSKMRDVFHVSLLKKKIRGKYTLQPGLPDIDEEGTPHVVPVKVLDQRMVKYKNRAKVEVLIQWGNLPASEATWEDWISFSRQYPTFAQS